VYGQKLIETPRLDRMAAEGTRFTQTYCGTSVCAPSRDSLMTGLHSGHCPVRGNWEIAPEGQKPLPAETVTVAEILKSAGYATACTGKWGMGFFDTSGRLPCCARLCKGSASISALPSVSIIRLGETHRRITIYQQ
jgi:arylsulfatase A-like enzyme